MKLTSAILALAVAFNLAAFADDPIIVRNEHYTLQLDGQHGDIQSFVSRGRELIFKAAEARSLFTLRLRQTNGAPVNLPALAAKEFSVARAEDARETRLTLNYSTLANQPVNVTVTVRCPKNEPMTYWSLALENRTGLLLDHIDFPTVVTPNDLVATGGDAYLFWPAMEGVLVDDVSIRESFVWKWRPIEHPTHGWIGLYPSSCPMQFMAYYGQKAGLYLAAHDPECNQKGIEFHPAPGGGIALDYRLFPGGIVETRYAMNYEMVLGVFQGDWYDAAARYRDWLEHSDMARPPKLTQNPALPAWFEESPVIVTYPVRGTKDMGDMTPNEYFPYTRALPHLRSLAKQFDSKILTLLMHWEGSAPWAPPYVWPPYGGTNDFNEFTRALHADGNLIGLYASGIGYTLRSNTDPTYGKEEEFDEKHLIDIVTRAPDDTPAKNGVCAGPKAQRIGYDMCPANAWVKDIVAREVAKILPSGVDYLQYFDQNIGGSCYRCYAHTHGHPAAPGPWQNEAMLDIFRRLQELVVRDGRKVLLGCEGASSEPFMPYLLFNDNRFTINFAVGSPVPAYAFVNHEYINNFMGNQNGINWTVDNKRSPLNLHQRVALSFVEGDFITAILKGGGQLCWNWGDTWTNAGPDHVSVTTLMRNLNAWRRGTGKPYLVYGRMLKPFPVAGDYELPMISPHNQKISFRSVFTSRWENGKTGAQILVNYTPQPQLVTVATGTGLSKLRLHTKPTGSGKSVKPDQNGQLVVELPPLSAALLEFVNAAKK